MQFISNEQALELIQDFADYSVEELYETIKANCDALEVQEETGTGYTTARAVCDGCYVKVRGQSETAALIATAVAMDGLELASMVEG